jgi:uncharacterized protein (TIGR03086 family)
MSENLRNYTKVLYGFEHVLRLVPEKALSKRSPCEGWKGVDVIAHSLGGVQSVFDAVTKAAMPTKMPKLGTDPLATYSKLRDKTLEALDHAGALQKISQTWFGAMPVDSFLPWMGADLTVHTWDLARTAKVDERLDPKLCKDQLALWKTIPREMLRGSGMFGAAIKSAPGADAQTKMLNFTGRAV